MWPFERGRKTEYRVPLGYQTVNEAAEEIIDDVEDVTAKQESSHGHELTKELDSALFPTRRTVPKISTAERLTILTCFVTYCMVINQEMVAKGRHLAVKVSPWTVESGVYDILPRLSAALCELLGGRLMLKALGCDPWEGIVCCSLKPIITLAAHLFGASDSIRNLLTFGLRTSQIYYLCGLLILNELLSRHPRTFIRFPTVIMSDFPAQIIPAFLGLYQFRSHHDAWLSRYRISWTCRCGTKFHGHLNSIVRDFSYREWYLDEDNHKLVKDYCERLVSQSSIISVTTAIGTFSTTGWDATTTQISTTSIDRAHIRNTWRELVPIRRSAAPVLPLTEIRPDVRSQNPPSDRYLLICLERGSYGREMHHLDLKDVSSDKQLFCAMRDFYWDKRMSRFTNHFRPSAIRAIRFVEFTLRRANMVDNLALGVMPKPEDTEYDYIPKPESPTCKPPKGPLDNRTMLHYLLECPALLEEDVLCLNQFPKRQSPLSYQNKDTDGSEHTNIGYGIYLKEGPHITRVYFLLLLAAVVLSLVVGAIYRWAVKGSSSDTLAVLAVSLTVVMVSGMMLTLYQADAKVDED